MILFMRYYAYKYRVLAHELNRIRLLHLSFENKITKYILKYASIDNISRLEKKDSGPKDRTEASSSLDGIGKLALTVLENAHFNAVLYKKTAEKRTIMTFFILMPLLFLIFLYPAFSEN